LRKNHELDLAQYGKQLLESQKKIA
jgi:hypothetical protein